MPHLTDLTDREWIRTLVAHDMRAYALADALADGPKVRADIAQGTSSVMNDMIRAEYVTEQDGLFDLTEDGRTFFKPKGTA
jgi:hypothetical protein